MIEIKNVIRAKVHIQGEIDFVDKADLEAKVRMMVWKELGKTENGENDEVFVPLKREVNVESRKVDERQRRTQISDMKQDLKDQINRDYHDVGIHVRDILRRYDISCKTLYTLLEEYGSPRRILPGLLVKKSDMLTMKKMSSSGKSIQRIRSFYKNLTEKQINAIIHYKFVEDPKDSDDMEWVSPTKRRDS
jgi:uncharacterized protein (DUF433 family)